MTLSQRTRKVTGEAVRQSCGNLERTSSSSGWVWCRHHNGASVPLKHCSDNGLASHAFRRCLLPYRNSILPVDLGSPGSFDTLSSHVILQRRPLLLLPTCPQWFQKLLGEHLRTEDRPPPSLFAAPALTHRCCQELH